MHGWSGSTAAGDGKAGAVPMFSFTASEAGINGTIPELETESANGAATGEELPPMVARVCGDLENIKTDSTLIIWVIMHNRTGLTDFNDFWYILSRIMICKKF